jgi:hypothetical protein
MMAFGKNLSKPAQAEIGAALCHQGPRRGLLKKTCPGIGKPGALGWQAMMMTLCANRVSVGRLMFLDLEEQEIFAECLEHCSKHARWINQHLQRPLEFNLFHFHNGG